MQHFQIRPARDEDRDVVFAFCAQTWDWGDYVEHKWDDWLHNPNGTLLVCTIDERPVGIVHLLMMTPTDAWSQGLRVDPQYRRQGIAKALVEAHIAEARHRGARYIYWVTGSENKAAHRIYTYEHTRR